MHIRSITLSLAIIPLLLLSACERAVAPDTKKLEEVPTETIATTHDDLFALGTEDWTHYTDEDWYITFDYRLDPDGYHLVQPKDATEEQKTYVLIRKEEYDSSHNSPGRGGPASINVSMFLSSNSQSPMEWALEHTDVTNLTEETKTTPYVVGGETGIQYEWEGMFKGNTVVVVKNRKMYVFTLMTNDEHSSMHEDFMTLLRSVKFL